MQIQAPKFGHQYKVYNSQEAEDKKVELAKKVLIQKLNIARQRERSKLSTIWFLMKMAPRI